MNSEPLGRGAILPDRSRIRGFWRDALRRNWRTVAAFSSLALDAAVISFTYLFALRVGDRLVGSPWVLDRYPDLLALFLAVFLGIYTALGVYRTTAQSSFYRQAYLAGKGFVYSLAVVLSVLFLLDGADAPRRVLLAFFAAYPFLYLTAWFVARLLLRLARKRGYGQWNTLAIGSHPQLTSLVQRLEAFPDLGYNIVDIIAISPEHNGEQCLHVDRSTVERVVRTKGIEFITFSTSRLNGSYEDLEGLCQRERIGMRVISPEADLLFSRTGLHDIAGIQLFTPARRRLDFAKRSLKRAFDIVGSLLCIVLLAPVFLLVALATKTESRGPILFKQKRSLSDHDEPFDFMKFRSMYHGADAQKETLLDRNEANGALFKMRGDPRTTKVGRLIRRYSIDELPQVFNVLKGDMSLVGPRPLPITDFSRMNEDDALGGYFRRRASVKPGMTGLWQISGRSDLGFREMVLLDLYYIEHQSVLFDIEILAQTVPVVLFGKGAY